MNVSVMSLLVEFLLQPTIAFVTLISIVASRDDQHRGFKKAVDILIALIGVSVLGYTARQLYATWHQIDTHGLLLQLVLPVWLTIGFLPFTYVFGLFANYEMAFTGIDWATRDRKARRRAKIALLTKFHFRARAVHDFPLILAERIATAPTLPAARHDYGLSEITVGCRQAFTGGYPTFARPVFP